MSVDLNDPKMDGYIPLDEIIEDEGGVAGGKVAEDIQLSTATLVFPDTGGTYESPSQAIVITNVGYDTVTIYGTHVEGEFELKSTVPGSLLAGETASVLVSFKPTTVGAKTGSIYFDTGNAAGDELVTLQGTGIVSAPEVPPDELQDFVEQIATDTANAIVGTKQDHSANLDAWSGLPTANKQNHSTNLDGWSGKDPAAFVLDEDDMASNSADKPPSQQSIRAYVDTADALKQDATFTPDFTLASPTVLKVLTQQHVSPLMFNTTPNGVMDNTLAMQRALAAAQEDAKPFHIDAGLWNLEETLVLDNSLSNSYLDRKKIDILGSGLVSSRVTCFGAGGLTIIGGKVSDGLISSQSFQRVSGFTLIGVNADNSVGLLLDTSQHIAVDFVQVNSFDIGMQGLDVDFASFRKLKTNWNKRGTLMSQRSPRETWSTAPNGIDFQGCQWAGNSIYAGTFIGGSLVSIRSGDVEGNGYGQVDRSGWGFLFQSMGVQGGVGANVEGVYFEANSGVADVWILANIAPDAGLFPQHCVHNIKHNDFHRIENVHYTTNNIVLTFAEAVGGKQIANIVGNSFKGYNTYVPDVGNKYVAWGGDARTALNTHIQGNLMQDAVEVVPQAEDDLTGWIDFSGTCTVTAAAGTFTAVVSSARYKLVGKRVDFSVKFTTTAYAATPTAPVTVTLPPGLAAKVDTSVSAINMTTVTGTSAIIGATLATARIWQSGVFPITANGQSMVVSGSYETA